MPVSTKPETSPVKLNGDPGLVRRGPPRYFHLLWEEDLEDMRPVLEALAARREGFDVP